MPTQVLETKLYAPRPRPGVVSRPRLFDLLARGSGSRLTVISAPPGFGKSTLLADWLATSAASGHVRTTAWLSLDPGDDDPRAFWTYVIGALDRAMPGVGSSARALLEADRVAIDAALTALLNALGEARDEVLLVLDDYHVISRPEIHDGLAYLLDHLPSQVHVLLMTRSDPPLPLARLRARGDLVEIRAADLRFSEDEAAAYLNGPMGLALTAGDVAALEGRTEGWIAALQLAALSIGGRPDPGTFIAAFAGDDRYIVDYLVEEVLERQPEPIQRFLLETSILDRLTGPLCDAVTTDEGGRATLESLERANLFVVALDDRRRWYRYHHLFADVLRARLQDERPQRIPTLHERASRWFEDQGDRAAAIEHALAAGDVGRAADLIELASHDLRARRQEMTLRRWLDALPDGAFDTRPVLAVAHAGALLATGETAGVEDRLAAAERWIGAGDGPRELAEAEAAGMVVRRPEVLAHLPSAIPLYRAALARVRGDVPVTIAEAHAALAAAGSDLPLERGGAAGMLALAHWTSGDLEASSAAWTQSFESLGAAGHRADLLGVSIALCDIRVTQGRLQDARAILERGLAIGTQGDHPPLRGTADMHVGLSEIDRERNDLPAARRHLDAAEALGEGMGLPQHPYRLRVAQARLALADGDADDAVRWLDEAARRYDADFFPDIRPIVALRARVRVRQGQVAEARAWAREAGIGPDDTVTFAREYEHATLVRVLVAEGIRDGDDDAIGVAISLAERLLAAAIDGERRGSAMDVLVILATAAQARRDPAAAARYLDQAVALAEPDRWVRVFLDEGPPMAALLAAGGDRGTRPTYLADLRTASRSAEVGPVRQPGLVEPLSDREMEVLRLLRSDLDGPDVANELHVSLNTLRTHTRNVYAKLGVNSRRAAVRRADELGLLARGDDRPST